MNGGLKKMSRLLLAGAGAVGLWGIGISSASAQSAQELQTIQAQIEQMQATIKSLQKQVQDAQAQAASAQAAASSGGMSDIDLKVKWKGAPEFSSADGKKFKFKVRGRIMADYNGIDQDEPITGEGDISAVELRRARLGVEGVIYYDWKYKFEVDFAANEVAIKDAYLAYANWGPDNWEISEIRVGNQYTYNSLEQITSSRFITFMERAAFEEAFFLDRQIGGAILMGGEHWSFQTGYYGATPGENGGVLGQEEFDVDQTAYTVRGTVAPINRDVNGVNQVVHLGASYRHRDAGELRDETTNFYQYRARGADLHLADRFVDTPQIFDQDDMFVLEAAFVWGSFSMQGEYAQLEGDIPPGFFAPGARRGDPTYDGWYVDASWYITGETRNYEAGEGIFGRTKVKRPVFNGDGGRGYGAWQIAGRYDVINLSDDGAFIPGCNECGNQETWLVALNWLLTDYTAIKLNVTQSKITGGNATGFNRNDGAEITGVGVRAQIDW
jgi:phosphate-selective porin OprO/OprP